MSNTSIFIEPEAFSSTHFYAGQYTENNQEYGFTLAVTHDMDNGMVLSTEITWIDDTPDNTAEAEEKILEDYYTFI